MVLRLAMAASGSSAAQRVSRRWMIILVSRSHSGEPCWSSEMAAAIPSLGMRLT